MWAVVGVVAVASVVVVVVWFAREWSAAAAAAEREALDDLDAEFVSWFGTGDDGDVAGVR